MTALVTLLSLLLLGPQAQHGTEWTYSGKAHPKGCTPPFCHHVKEGGTRFSRTKPGLAGRPCLMIACGACWGLKVSGWSKSILHLDLG